jgi:hypothetical protein
MIKSRKIRWVEHLSQMRESRNACKIKVRKPEKKRLIRNWQR